MRAATTNSLPAMRQANATTRSIEQLETELPDLLRPGVSGNETATPRSSPDSGRSTEWWEEDLSGSIHASNYRRDLENPPVENAAVSPSESPNTPTSDLFKPASHLSNPFRRKVSNNGFKDGSENISDGYKLDQGTTGKSREAYIPGKTFLPTSSRYHHTIN